MTCSCSNELNSSVGFTVTEYLPCRTFSARSSCFSSTGLAIYMSVYAHEYVCVLVVYTTVRTVVPFIYFTKPKNEIHEKIRKIIKTMKIIWHFRRVRSLESCVLTWIFYSFSPGRNRSRFAVN